MPAKRSWPKIAVPCIPGLSKVRCYQSKRDESIGSVEWTLEARSHEADVRLQPHEASSRSLIGEHVVALLAGIARDLLHLGSFLCGAFFQLALGVCLTRVVPSMCSDSRKKWQMVLFAQQWRLVRNSLLSKSPPWRHFIGQWAVGLILVRIGRK